MNPGPFHMLHDARNQDIPAIRDHIHFKLRSRHVLVDEHRIFNGVFQNAGHVRPDSLIRPGNGHVLSADDIRWTKEHRIPQGISRLQRLLHGQGRPSPGPPDPELFKEGIKADAVLGQVDAIRRGAQNLYPALVQVFGQLDGRLTAKSHHDALRLFHLQDLLHILPEKRFKIEPVRRVVVR